MGIYSRVTLTVDYSTFPRQNGVMSSDCLNFPEFKKSSSYES